MARAQILKGLWTPAVTPTSIWTRTCIVHVLPQLSPILIALARRISVSATSALPPRISEATLPLLWKIEGASMAAVGALRNRLWSEFACTAIERAIAGGWPFLP